jgi:hypothetical protein
MDIFFVPNEKIDSRSIPQAVIIESDGNIRGVGAGAVRTRGRREGCHRVAKAVGDRKRTPWDLAMIGVPCDGSGAGRRSSSCSHATPQSTPHAAEPTFHKSLPWRGYQPWAIARRVELRPSSHRSRPRNGRGSSRISHRRILFVDKDRSRAGTSARETKLVEVLTGKWNPPAVTRVHVVPSIGTQ